MLWLERRTRVSNFEFASKRIVGLLRNKKISASGYRRSGPQAAQDFARLLDAEGKIS